MKEHPILFSGDMAKAILDGRKTMTRRVIKNAPAVINESNVIPELIQAYKDAWLKTCPYGQPGDRLWVRETWAIGDRDEDVIYAADPQWDIGTIPLPPPCNHGTRWKDCWRPSIHMPRWASRITLEITAVRVERVQDISEEDAKAEGCGGYAGGEGPVNECVLAVEPGYLHQRFFRDGFRFLWDSLNLKRGYGWEANPWVRVISFKRVP